MAGAKNHEYHILPPEHLAADRRVLGAGVAPAACAVDARRSPMADWLFLGLGIAGLITMFFSWWSNVISEAQPGDHTPVVQLHLRYGMILFIASEVMFFVGWFWAWFDFALFPIAAGRRRSAGSVAAQGDRGGDRTRSICRCSTR